MNSRRKQYFSLAQRIVKALCAPEHINIIQIENGTNNDEQFILAVRPLALKPFMNLDFCAKAKLFFKPFLITVLLDQ